jgi:NAD(P)H-hydrate repair Nnr-like enzyme with NAD(P)H-hydrate dehydratase domain
MSLQFQKQSDKPLFPNVLWSRPVSRRQGGRLLIVGGQTHGINEVQAIYQAAMAAGAGESQLAVPDTLSSMLAPTGLGIFMPASGSGSLGKAAAGNILHVASDYDALVVAGNLTNNSE